MPISVGMNPHLEAALDTGRGFVARSALPTHQGAIQGALQRGDIVAVLPGIYARAATASDLSTVARAVRLRDPDAVVIRESAAHLQGWWEVPRPEKLQVASVRLRTSRRLTLERRAIPRHLTRTLDGLRTTSRAMTAVELVDTLGPVALDNALRRGVPLAELRRAAESRLHCRGVVGRRWWVARSSTRPFSPAERAAHEALRAASLGGWTANAPILDERGDVIGYGDLVFDDLDLVLEIDGRHHLVDPQLSRDRRRDRRFATRGWMVVRLPADLALSEPAAFVDEARDIVSARRTALDRRAALQAVKICE